MRSMNERQLLGLAADELERGAPEFDDVPREVRNAIEIAWSRNDGDPIAKHDALIRIASTLRRQRAELFRKLSQEALFDELDRR